MKERMKGLDDKHIEQMMQEAAENFVPAYNPDAWTQMQAKMVSAGMTPAPVTNPWPLIIRIVAGAILIISLIGGTYFYYDNSDIEQQSVTNVSTESDINKEQNTVADNFLDQKSDKELIESEEILDLPTNSPQQEITKSEISNSSESNKEAVIDDDSKNTESQDEAITESRSEIKIAIPVNVNQANMVDNDLSMTLSNEQHDESVQSTKGLISTGDIENIIQDSNEDNSYIFNGVELKKLQETELIEYSKFEILKVTADTSITQEIEEEDQIKSRSKRFAVSFLLSPDFSGAEISKLKGTGIDVGLMFEYFLSNRISINSGIQYGSKKYFVDEGFEGYSDRWPGRAEPDEVDASCTVIDIPVNVKYYFHENGRTRFFMNAGVTSYIMLTEDYLYKYNSASVEDWAVSIENENKHFFGLMSFSFGIQKNVGKGFYIVAEPFYKVPIQGIGAGKVNLNSSGLYLSIKKDF